MDKTNKKLKITRKRIALLRLKGGINMSIVALKPNVSFDTKARLTELGQRAEKRVKKFQLSNSQDAHNAKVNNDNFKDLEKEVYRTIK